RAGAGPDAFVVDDHLLGGKAQRQSVLIEGEDGVSAFVLADEACAVELHLPSGGRDIEFPARDDDAAGGDADVAYGLASLGLLGEDLAGVRDVAGLKDALDDDDVGDVG